MEDIEKLSQMHLTSPLGHSVEVLDISLLPSKSLLHIKYRREDGLIGQIFTPPTFDGPVFELVPRGEDNEM